MRHGLCLLMMGAMAMAFALNPSLLPAAEEALQGDVLTIPSQEAPVPTEAALSPMPTEAAPQTYIVQRGDTLWGICLRFVNDPLYWPKLWAMNNDVITNPHLIYPGWLVRFTPGPTPKLEIFPPGEVEATAKAMELPPVLEPVVEPEPVSEPESEAEETIIIVPPRQKKGLTGNFLGFVSPELYRESGEITNTKLGHTLLVNGDIVYAKFPVPVTPGERFSIYRSLGKLQHPVSGDEIGYQIQMLGSLEVVALGDRFAEAKIVDSWEEIIRGDRLKPYEEEVQQVSLAPNQTRVEGYIIQTRRQSELISEQDMVYIDRGSKDGVEVGNLFRVYRKGDPLDPQAKDLPEYSVGEMVIVSTKEKTSLALVTDTTQELRIGDIIRMDVE